MTVTSLPTGSVQCDVCGRFTGNLAMHRPKCARSAGRLPLTTAVSPDEERHILRAGVHGMPAADLEPEARLGRGVNDLDVARLVLQIERGTVVYPTATMRTWKATPAMPTARRSLTTVVAEALRLGIVYPITLPMGLNVFRTQLEAAPTHARRAGCVNRPACLAIDPKVLRWRLLNVGQLAYVDCQACMDVPMSCVQR